MKDPGGSGVFYFEHYPLPRSFKRIHRAGSFSTVTPTATETPFATFTPTATGTDSPTPTATGTETLTPTDTFTSTFTPTPTQTPIPSGPVTIDYVYDPLNRLTEANYSNNDYYHYIYDGVGNRKVQERMVSGSLSTTSYNYDIANRLTDVNGVLYTWDDNGNLRDDGVNTYGYDSANRLKTLTGPSVATNYSYNGLGDRIQETVDGNTRTLLSNLGSLT